VENKDTGWRRLIGSPKLQIIFHKRATKYRSLLRKMTYKDKGSYESSPPCIHTSRLQKTGFDTTFLGKSHKGLAPTYFAPRLEQSWVDWGSRERESKSTSDRARERELGQAREWQWVNEKSKLSVSLFYCATMESFSNLIERSVNSESYPQTLYRASYFRPCPTPIYFITD